MIPNFPFQSSGGGGDSLLSYQVFTTSGTYTPTAGMRRIYALVIGGGGAVGLAVPGNGGTCSLGALLSATGGAGSRLQNVSFGGSAAGVGAGGTNGTGQSGTNLWANNAITPGVFVLEGTCTIFANTARGAIVLDMSSSSGGASGSSFGSGATNGESITTNMYCNAGASGGWAMGSFDAGTVGASQTITVPAAATGDRGNGARGVVMIWEYA